MPFSEDQKREVARQMGQEMFVAPRKPAILGTDDIEAAIAAIDNFFDQQANAMGRLFPEPFNSVASEQEKQLLIATVLRHRAGKSGR